MFMSFGLTKQYNVLISVRQIAQAVRFILLGLLFFSLISLIIIIKLDT